MKTIKALISLVIQVFGLLVLLYFSWELARWFDPAETTSEFLSAGGIIEALCCLVGLLVLVLSVAWLFRSSIKHLRTAWREWR